MKWAAGPDWAPQPPLPPGSARAPLPLAPEGHLSLPRPGCVPNVLPDASLRFCLTLRNCPRHLLYTFFNSPIKHHWTRVLLKIGGRDLNTRLQVCSGGRAVEESISGTPNCLSLKGHWLPEVDPSSMLGRSLKLPLSQRERRHADQQCPPWAPARGGWPRCHGRAAWRGKPLVVDTFHP